MTESSRLHPNAGLHGALCFILGVFVGLALALPSLPPESRACLWGAWLALNAAGAAFIRRQWLGLRDDLRRLHDGP